MKISEPPILMGEVTQDPERGLLTALSLLTGRVHCQGVDDVHNHRRYLADSTEFLWNCMVRKKELLDTDSSKI